jgi:hypothetical protein
MGAPYTVGVKTVSRKMQNPWTGIVSIFKIFYKKYAFASSP